MCHSHCLCIRSTAFREECVNVHLDRRSIETSFELLQRDRGMKQLGNLLHIHRLGCRAGRSRGAHQANTRPCVPSSFTTHRTLSCEPFFAFTFTFTFICHPGKTHNHRSRGDTPWRARTVFLRKGQLNRHTRYRPATTARNTATQRSLVYHPASLLPRPAMSHLASRDKTTTRLDVRAMATVTIVV